MRLGATYFAQFADGRLFFFSFFMGVRPASCRVEPRVDRKRSPRGGILLQNHVNSSPGAESPGAFLFYIHNCEEFLP
jgi:hypothetical protein